MANFDADVEIKIGADTLSAEKAIAQLEKSITKAYKSPQSSMQKMGVQALKLETQIKSVAQKMEQLGSKRVPTEGYERLQEKLRNLQQEANKTKAELDGLASKDLNRFNSQRFQNVEAIFHNYQKEIAKVQSAMSDMRTKGTAFEPDAELEGRLSALQTVYTELIRRSQFLNKQIDNSTTKTHKLADAFKGVLKAVGKAFINTGKLIKNHVIAKNDEASKSFKNLFKQVLKYGLGVRSLFLLYKKLRQYGKEAFKDMATQYPEINAQLSDLVATFSQMTHSIATAFQPLLSIVLPILNAIMNAAIAAANAIGSFFAALTGQGFIYKAVKQQKNFAGAIGGTGGAAKKAKEELAEYDKLLVISQDNDGGGGGGGGGGAGDTTFFEKSDLMENAADFAKMIKDAWKDADFTEVGELIGEKLTHALQSIPWDKIHAVAAKVGKSIATLLNGIISPELFSEIGNFIAQALNTPIEATRAFLENFKWNNLGYSLAEGLNRFVKEIHLEQFGKNIHDAITGIVEAADTLFARVKFDDIGAKIARSLNEVFKPDALGGIGRTFGNALKSLADTLYGLITNFDWRTAGTSFVEMLNEFVRTADWGKIASTISEGVKGALEFAISGFKNADGTAFAKAVVNIIKNVDWGGLLGGVVEFIWASFSATLVSTISLSGEVLKAIVEWFEDIGKAGWNGFWKGLWGVVSDVAVWVKEQFEKYIVNPIKDLFGIHSPSTLMAEIGGFVMQGFLNGLVKVFETIKTWITGAVQWIIDKFNTAIDKIKEFIGIKDEVEYKGLQQTNLSKGAKATNTTQTQTVQTTTTETVQGPTINTNASLAEIQKVQTALQQVGRLASTTTAQIDNSFRGLASRVSSYTTSFANSFRNAFKNVSQLSHNAVQSIVKGFTSLPTSLSAIFRQAYTQSIQQFASISTWASSIYSMIANSQLKNVPALFVMIFRQAVEQSRIQVMNFASWFKSLNFDKTATLSINTPSVAKIQGIWSAIAGVWRDKTATFSIKVNSNVDDFKNLLNTTVIAKLNRTFAGNPIFKDVRIPYLAQGAVLPPNKPFMAMLGDQKNGTNIETPLDTMIEAFTIALDSRGSSNNEPIVLQLDGRTVAQCVWDEEEKRYKQTGTRYRYT